jgi:hypothetical protein
VCPFASPLALVDDFDRRSDMLECDKDETRDLGGNKEAGFGFIPRKRGGDDDTVLLKLRAGGQGAVVDVGWRKGVNREAHWQQIRRPSIKYLKGDDAGGCGVMRFLRNQGQFDTSTAA